MSQNSTAGMMSVAHAAQLLMVSDEWLRQLANKGYIPKAVSGLYPIAPTVQGYIRWLKDEERRTSKTAAASAVQQARAKEIELRIAKESGKLLELEDTEAAFANILGAFRSELAGVPAASTRDLALREVIDGHLNDAIARARDRFRQFIEAIRASGNSGVDDKAPVS